MKRKDEIRQAKSKYAEENPIYEWVECEEDYFLNEEKVSVIFEAGAEWADKTMIEKACKWLEENADKYVYREYDEWDDQYDAKYNKDKMIKAFRKLMED